MWRNGRAIQNGEERQTRFSKAHSPKEIPKEESTKSRSVLCRNLSKVDSLPNSALKLFASYRPPGFSACSKYAYSVQPPPFHQLFCSVKNSPYSRSPVRFQGRLLYNPSIGYEDFEPLCYRARQNGLTNHSQVIDQTTSPPST